MPLSLLSSCSDGCGWAASVVSALSWGSFGVPIKLNSKVEVDPLVMQSFKTLVCFATSWMVVLLGEEVRWSNYGILSGLFWVPGATCGVYGIRNAGLAVAVGTWSSINVLTSFFFGIVIFQEKVKDVFGACLAFLCLAAGLIGMSRYSSPLPDNKQEFSQPMAAPRKVSPQGQHQRKNIIASSGTTAVGEEVLSPLEVEPLVASTDDENDIMEGSNSSDIALKDPRRKERLVFLGGRLSMTRRQTGILGAVINGAWGGLNLIPLHFALRDDGLTGAGYLISYAGGAFIVNACIWILLFAYYLYHKRGRWHEALDCLPKWHLDELLVPGILAGLLYSLGNFAAIIAVTHLGQGTGYSVCQMQLFVSGLWGVFYFREIKGFQTISKWFLSAAVAVVGILWLSYEHEGSGGHRL